MTGWISLHRQIKEHWIWEDPQKLKWWVDILLRVNHKDNKTVVGNKLTVIKRGTFHTSEVKLAEQWNVSRNTVRAFLKLLESDEMITTKRTRNGTTVEVRNYNDYQTFSQDKKQPSAQQVEQQTAQQVEQRTEQQTEQRKDSKLNTNNNVNNDLTMNNNENNDNNSQSVGVVFDKYAELGFGAINSYKAEQIQDWLNTFDSEVIIKSFEIASNQNKATMNYVNGILNNWKQRGLTTIEKVEAEEKKKQVEQFKPSYQQRMRERQGEKAPEWLNKEKETPKVKNLKKASEDPELATMINQFRNG